MKKLFATLTIAMAVFIGSSAIVPALFPQSTQGIAFAQAIGGLVGNQNKLNDNNVLDEGVFDTGKDIQDAGSTSTGKGEPPANVDQSIGFMNCGNTEFGCMMINGLYYLLILGGNFLVGIAAWVMDFFLGYSLLSTSYSNSGVILQGWEILRDFTNIVFIFALLSAAFRMVLGDKGSAAKAQVMKIIGVALAINFSLYLSFAVIDVGNVLANVLYNKIVQTSKVLKTCEVLL